ncbi:MAG: ATP-binding protein, partial [Pseudomonadota bacterium]
CGLDYQARVSGPLLDRIDIQIEIPALTPAEIAAAPLGESSARVAERVAHARQAQTARYAGSGVRLNAQAAGQLLDEVARPDASGQRLLDDAAQRLRLSARAYHRVLRLARSIADLAGVERVGKAHIAEAVGYRRAPLTR